MRLYIAGPMSNLPLFNFPAFDDAEAYLRSVGIVPWSPAAHDREVGLDETKYPTGDVAQAAACGDFSGPVAFRWDLDRIVNHSEGILRLRGWERSSGTALELAVNKAIGGRVFEPVYFEQDRMVGIVEVFDV